MLTVAHVGNSGESGLALLVAGALLERLSMVALTLVQGGLDRSERRRLGQA